MEPKLLFLFGFYLPFLAIGVPMLSQMKQSVGQVFEVDRDQLALYQHGVTLWQIRWSDVSQVSTFQNGMEFLDRTGQRYRVILMNVPRTKARAIRTFIPASTPIEIQKTEYFRRMPSSLAYALGICGTALLFWGGVGVVKTIVALRTRSDDGLPIDQQMLLWQTGALLVGIFVAMIGWSRIFRKPASVTPVKSSQVSLSDHLSAAAASPFAQGTRYWRPKPNWPSRRKSQGWLLAVACLFWGTMYAFVIRETLLHPRDLFLFGLYTLIIAFHGYGIYQWTQLIDPTGWVIQTDGANIWAVGNQSSYNASIKKTNSSWTIDFSVEDRKRQLDATDFELDL